MPEPVSLRHYPADVDFVPAAVAETLSAVDRAGLLDEGRAVRLELALEEVLVNVCRHAYRDQRAPGGEKEFAVEVRALPDRLEVSIEDSGRAFDPTTLSPPDTDASLDERPVGGLGIHLVRSMVDGMEYRRDGERNRLTLTMVVGAAETGG